MVHISKFNNFFHDYVDKDATLDQQIMMSIATPRNLNISSVHNINEEISTNNKVNHTYSPSFSVDTNPSDNAIDAIPLSPLPSDYTLRQCLFRLGQRVSIDNGRFEGILKYYGRVQFQEGLWAGVELDQPLGKNDGSISGIRYFHCSPNHGIFVGVHRIQPSSVIQPSDKSKDHNSGGLASSMLFFDEDSSIVLERLENDFFNSLLNPSNLLAREYLPLSIPSRQLLSESNQVTSEYELLSIRYEQEKQSWNELESSYQSKLEALKNDLEQQQLSSIEWKKEKEAYTESLSNTISLLQKDIAMEHESSKLKLKHLENDLKEQLDQCKNVIDQQKRELEELKTRINLLNEQQTAQLERNRTLQVMNELLHSEVEQLKSGLDQTMSPIRKSYLEKEIVHLLRYKADLENQIEKKQKIDSMDIASIVKNQEEELKILQNENTELEHTVQTKEEQIVYYSSTLTFLRQSIGRTLSGFLWCSYEQDTSNNTIANTPNHNAIDIDDENQLESEIYQIREAIQKKTSQLLLTVEKV